MLSSFSRYSLSRFYCNKLLVGIYDIKMKLKLDKDRSDVVSFQTMDLSLDKTRVLYVDKEGEDDDEIGWIYSG